MTEIKVIRCSQSGCNTTETPSDSGVWTKVSKWYCSPCVQKALERPALEWVLTAEELPSCEGRYITTDRRPIIRQLFFTGDVWYPDINSAPTAREVYMWLRPDALADSARAALGIAK